MKINFEELLRDLVEGGKIEKYVNINQNGDIEFKASILNTYVHWLQELKYKDKDLKNINISEANLKEIIYNLLTDCIYVGISITYKDFFKLCHKKLKNDYIITSKIINNKHNKNVIFSLITTEDERDNNINEYTYVPVMDKISYNLYLNNNNATRETTEYKKIKYLLENENNVLRKDATGQRKIINLLMQGLNQKQIAEKLNTTEINVSQQIKKIRNRIEKKYIPIPEVNLYKELQDIHNQMENIFTYKKNYDFIGYLKFIADKYKIDESINLEELVDNKNNDNNDYIEDIMMENLSNKDRAIFIDCVINNKPCPSPIQIFYRVLCNINTYLIRINNSHNKMNNYNKQLHNIDEITKIG